MKSRNSCLNKLGHVVLIALCLIYIPQWLSAETPTTKPATCWVINADFVNRLFLPKDAEELRKAYKDLPYHDVVLDMVYYMRLRTMKHTEKDDLDFLQTMPKNPVEFSFLYSVSFPDNKQRFPDLNDYYQSYFEIMCDLVIQHPQFLTLYFLQVYFSDGETADRLQSCISKIRKVIPGKVDAVLKKCPREVKIRIINE